MKSVFSIAQLAVVAFVVTCTFGCAPPAPTDVDTSTAVSTAPAASSNITTGAETPGSNVTTGAETPVSETPVSETPEAAAE